MYEAMQPGWLWWQMITYGAVALIPNNHRFEFGLQELENLWFLIAQLLLRPVVRNRKTMRF